MSTRPPTIVAMGGGGFSMEPDNLLLDRFVLELAGVDAPRVAFFPTASSDPDTYVANFHEAFASLGAVTEEVLLPWESAIDGKPEDGRPLAEADPVALAARLASCDAIYVGGGNTRRMLAVWRAYGVDPVLKRLWAEGRAVMAGVSAGSICWFEQGVTDSIPGKLTPMQGMGWIGGSNCPHYDGEALRRPSYEALVGDGTLQPGMAADDGCALVYRGTDLVDVVSSRPEAYAWRVDRVGDGAASRRTDARYLGPLAAS